METIVLGRGPLTLAQLSAVALDHAPVALDPTRRAELAAIRAKVETLLHPEAPNVYGVNTGFGALAEVRQPFDFHFATHDMIPLRT